MVMGTLGKYNRSVSIIGVGCTPFMYTVDNPETDGLTEGEMFGYAALKAMEDAGVNPQDVDFYFHGEASPLNGSNYLTPNVQVLSLIHIFWGTYRYDYRYKKIVTRLPKLEVNPFC